MSGLPPSYSMAHAVAISMSVAEHAAVITLKYLGLMGGIRVTEEKIDAVCEDGSLQVGDALLKTSGDTRGLRAWSPVAVLWNRRANQTRGVVKTTVLAHQKRQGAAGDASRAASSKGTVEILSLDDAGALWLTDEFDCTKILSPTDVKAGGFVSAIWAPKVIDNVFLLSAWVWVVEPFTRKPIYLVVQLNRGAGTRYSQGQVRIATVIKRYSVETPIPYGLYDNLDRLQGTSKFPKTVQTRSGSGPSATYDYQIETLDNEVVLEFHDQGRTSAYDVGFPVALGIDEAQEAYALLSVFKDTPDVSTVTAKFWQLDPKEIGGSPFAQVLSPTLIQDPKWQQTDVVVSFPITSVSSNTFTVTGDASSLNVGSLVNFNVVDSPSNDGTYLVVSAVYSSPSTVITVFGTIFSSTPGGKVVPPGGRVSYYKAPFAPNVTEPNNFAVVLVSKKEIAWSSSPAFQQLTKRGKFGTFGYVGLRKNPADTGIPGGGWPVRYAAPPGGVFPSHHALEAGVPRFSGSSISATPVLAGWDHFASGDDDAFNYGGLAVFGITTIFVDTGLDASGGATLSFPPSSQQGQIFGALGFSTSWVSSGVKYWIVAAMSGGLVLDTSIILVGDPSGAQVVMAWHFSGAVVSAADEYRVYRANAIGGPYQRVPTALTPSAVYNTTPVYVPGTSFGTTRTSHVKAFDMGNWGYDTLEIPGWELGFLPAPEAPTTTEKDYVVQYRGGGDPGYGDGGVAHVTGKLVDIQQTSEPPAIEIFQGLATPSDLLRRRFFVTFRQHGTDSLSGGAAYVIDGRGSLVMTLRPAWDSEYASATVVAANERYLIWLYTTQADERSVFLTDMKEGRTDVLATGADVGAVLDLQLWLMPGQALLFSRTLSKFVRFTDRLFSATTPVTDGVNAVTKLKETPAGVTLTAQALHLVRNQERLLT